MVLFGGLLLLLAIQSALCEEYSVGTNMNNFLKLPDEEASFKRNNDAKTQSLPLWFGPRFGKRSQFPDELLSPEILEIFERIEKSPELQKLIASKMQFGESWDSLMSALPKIQERSRPFTPRYGRDASDTNLNSRPYPPRFGRSSMNELPPYLPRLG